MIAPFTPATGTGLVNTISAVTAASAPTGASQTFTLPSEGVFLLTAVAKLNGSLDHMMFGTWLVGFQDSTNDSLGSDLLGTVKKASGSSFGLTTLAATGPTAAGVVTITATWTNGNSYSIVWDFSCRTLYANFG